MSREREVVFLFIPLLCKKRPGEGENNATTFSVDKNVTTMCIRCTRWTWRIVLRFLFKGQRDECRRRCLSAEPCPAPSVSFRFFRFISLHVELTNVKEGKFRGSLFAFRVRDKNVFRFSRSFIFCTVFRYVFSFDESDEQDIKGSSEIFPFLFLLGNLFKSIFFFFFKIRWRILYKYICFKNRY